MHPPPARRRLQHLATFASADTFAVGKRLQDELFQVGGRSFSVGCHDTLLLGPAEGEFDIATVCDDAGEGLDAFRRHQTLHLDGHQVLMHLGEASGVHGRERVREARGDPVVQRHVVQREGGGRPRKVGDRLSVEVLRVERGLTSAEERRSKVVEEGRVLVPQQRQRVEAVCYRLCIERRRLHAPRHCRQPRDNRQVPYPEAGEGVEDDPDGGAVLFVGCLAEFDRDARHVRQ
mmetsp:Transcript_51323/g.122196  ORF Transcript_51323/g.122196 Transcript_51323/m.122196 type:complete len:233 (-) Transcript_51323:572-1270(-)